MPLKKWGKLLVACLIISGLGGCGGREPQDRVPVRNLILLIGDGMGPQQVGLAITYVRHAPESVVPNRRLRLEDLMREGEVAWMTTGTYGAIVADSAASASQLATGRWALPETLGLDEAGNRVETVLQKAIRSGRGAGLVTDTRLTHATPAAFAAHQPHRSLENEIASDMLETAPHVLLSAGLRHFLPRSVNDRESDTFERVRAQIPEHIEVFSRRRDERNLLEEAREKGYVIVFTRAQLESAAAGRVLGLFDASEMPDGIAVSRTGNDPQRRHPTLSEMTRRALDILSAGENGFFLMVEGGQIDWAGHNNDVATMLHEMLHFDKAIGVVHDWVRERSDTLVVVAADHETGSFGFSYSVVDIPEAREVEGDAFRDRLYSGDFNFGDYDLLDRIYAQRKSFQRLFSEFYALPSARRTPAELVGSVKENVGFSVTVEEAAAVLADEPNPHRLPGHRYMDLELVPKINDFNEFYPYVSGSRGPLLARALASRQQVVWGTGTHTAVPVPLVVWGPEGVRSRFRGVHHSTEVGRLMMEVLRQDAPSGPGF